ncbi:helix-turn-helix transcriptional regulator [Streptosporangium pseudovulgare]|uniref:Transcriptional regulator n=1 Tax=Streptosporangium pseudovulgare TaxID=35765 RepID=A0ABQ2QN21_9ACTN|nr:WYL domain-containing protein [Streptosporangium pseudovulgare]GGP85299.1 transcriptional regulator [Streptosporangium pseudovulgare]
MNRTDRLCVLVEELRAAAPGFLRVRELADRLGVGERTVERDLAALRESGVPVRAEPGGRGGHALDTSAAPSPVAFTAEEAAAVAVALVRAADTPLAGPARDALRRLAAATPSPGEVRHEDAAGGGRGGGAEGSAGDGEAGRPVGGGGNGGAERSAGGGEGDGAGWPVVPARAAAEPEPYPRVAAVIEGALLRRRVLRLGYEDRKGRSTVREVEPAVFMGGRGGQWYLMGMDRLRQDVRVFKLDRIAWAEETAEAAPEQPPERYAAGLPGVLRESAGQE